MKLNELTPAFVSLGLIFILRAFAGEDMPLADRVILILGCGLLGAWLNRAVDRLSR